MTQMALEVPEAQAEGKIKSIYDEIKSTFRVPRVAPAFRRLAAHPDYLIPAWAALKPNAQTRYFEHEADGLRRAAVEAAVLFGPSAAVDASVEPLVQVAQYAVSRFFVAVTALRIAGGGSQPRMRYLSPEETRQVAPGEPGEVSFGELRPDTSDEKVQTLLDHIDELSGLQSLSPELRALLDTPGYLEEAWPAMKAMSMRTAYRQAQRSLSVLAEHVITALPFRMDLSPHVLRQTGLSEHEIDEVRDILDRAHAAAGATLLNTAFLAMGGGGTAA